MFQWVRTMVLPGHPKVGPDGATTLYRSFCSLGVVTWERVSHRFGKLNQWDFPIEGQSEFGRTLIVKIPEMPSFPPAYLVQTSEPDTGRSYVAFVNSHGAMGVTEYSGGRAIRAGRFPVEEAAGFFREVLTSFCREKDF